MSLVSGPGRGGGPRVSQLADETSLAVERHVEYIRKLDTRRDELDYWLTEHLRLNGVYWGLTALHLLGRPEGLPRQETIDFVLSCQNNDGGFGAAPGHDSHLLYSVSAVQILTSVDALNELERPGFQGPTQVGQYLANLQQRDTGTFAGDVWGETDTRFLGAALIALSLLGLTSLIDMDKAVEYLLLCRNYDGGFGVCPGAESHAAQIFPCLSALTIAKRLDVVDRDRLGAWLCERQLGNGGLNGRPEKMEDVCYSWWVLSSLAMIDRLHWIDADKLSSFIVRCQDPVEGGISDRPGDMVDVFHTVFGIAGLSLLGHRGLVEVHPAYCMPRHIIHKQVGKPT